MINWIYEDFLLRISASIQTLVQINFCIVNTIPALTKTSSLTAQGKCLK